ncbi:mitochondrial ribosomal protein L31-domain-containing protein [Xylariaceae sp. FL0804]|nr:mitochondrial ribosomal protein L31-domain-containing protein [Xylariaceae sp. FL0804]
MPLSGGLLWKTPWRLSKFQKARQRARLRAVDAVVATLDAALARKGETLKALETWKETMPTEDQMLPRDKYTMFDRKQRRYRKGIHSTSYDVVFFLMSTPSPVPDLESDPEPGLESTWPGTACFYCTAL